MHGPVPLTLGERRREFRILRHPLLVGVAADYARVPRRRGPAGHSFWRVPPSAQAMMALRFHVKERRSVRRYRPCSSARASGENAGEPATSTLTANAGPRVLCHVQYRTWQRLDTQRIGTPALGDPSRLRAGRRRGPRLACSGVQVRHGPRHRTYRLDYRVASLSCPDFECPICNLLARFGYT